MKTYRVTLEVKLDPTSGDLPANWLRNAIEEQLEDGELIEYYTIKEISE